MYVLICDLVLEASLFVQYRIVTSPSLFSLDQPWGFQSFLLFFFQDPDKSIVDISKRKVTFLSGMSNVEGSIITFYNVSYFVKFKTGYLGFRKEIKKNILFNIR